MIPASQMRILKFRELQILAPGHNGRVNTVSGQADASDFIVTASRLVPP